MTSARYSRRVVLALSVGVAGAISGALSAYDADAALKVIMALIGFLFGTVVGAFLIILATVVQGRFSRPKLRERHSSTQLSLELQENLKVLDDFYPGNPDPLSRKLTGWRLPSERR